MGDSIQSIFPGLRCLFGMVRIFFPGVVDGEFVVSFFDANELANEPAPGEDSQFLPSDVAGGGDFAEEASRSHIRREGVARVSFDRWDGSG